ncbi:hypothetical protein QII42_gp1 [ssRNA phage Gerhypos.2_18]|uniref:Uncharacterized protein n=2 Tax=Norzivirales TaxID=2842247 RepID=A0A8S5L003_9VIRU|nr:hypothetical protein QII42_gp1 [ssRNA phage Gerhypos.2_18]QDH89022.1 MAG: hypothetical protein H2Bulk35251_000001 [Leviviridae sp.]DAD50434.1 TPA_asm: hypothetical protein [ssRNA phage Gerhypos.2_18]
MPLNTISQYSRDALDRVDRELSKVPVNSTYLDGFAAGVLITSLLETASGELFDEASTLWSLYYRIYERYEQNRKLNGGR